MKQFLIIGTINAIGYKEVFPLIKDNQMWCGISGFSGGLYFYTKDDYDTSVQVKPSKVENGRIAKWLGGVCWFTNMTHYKRMEGIKPTKHYDVAKYKKYDNYNAINVNKIKDIPMDYDGIMGVPLSIIDRYNPNQYEIIWQASGNTRHCCPMDILDILGYVKMDADRGGCGLVDMQRKYLRIFIRKI